MRCGLSFWDQRLNRGGASVQGTNAGVGTRAAISFDAFTRFKLTLIGPRKTQTSARTVGLVKELMPFDAAFQIIRTPCRFDCDNDTVPGLIGAQRHTKGKHAIVSDLRLK